MRLASPIPGSSSSAPSASYLSIHLAARAVGLLTIVVLLTIMVTRPVLGRGGTESSPPPPRARVEIRLNCGGQEYVDHDGQFYLADQPLGSSPGGYIGGEGRTYHGAPPVAGTQDPELYVTCRAGEFDYRFALPSDSYHVRLHFAEHEFFVIDGVRPFDIVIEGEVAFAGYDIHEPAWRHYATCLSRTVEVIDDSLTLRIAPRIEEAELCAIEIVPAGAAGPALSTPAVSITPGYNLLTLSMPTPSGPRVAGYRVRRSTSAGGPYTTMTASPWHATRFHDRSATAGTTYYYRVAEVTHEGASGTESAPLAGMALDPTASPLPVFEITISDSLHTWLRDNIWTDDYVTGAFRHGSQNFSPVGLRFRGVVARTYPRKNWKVKLDEYVAGQQLWGQDRINLNSQWPDPTHLREYTAYSLAAAISRVHIDCFPLHLDLRTEYDGTYRSQFHGVYTWFEQVDQDFFDQYGLEDVVLYKIVPADPPGDLSLRDTYEEYVASYEKKTYEAEGYQDLIDFIELLNLTPDHEFVSAISDHFAVDDYLDRHAHIVLISDWDKYWNNYFIYREHAGSRWSFLTFDYDNTFADMFDLDWGQGQYVLPTRVLAQPVFRLLYARKVKKLLDSWWQPSGIIAHVDSLGEALESEIALDRRRAFDAGTFAPSLDELENWMQLRRLDVRQQLESYWPIDPLFITEVVTENTVLADEHGDYEPWIELKNTGDSPCTLAGVWVTDDLGDEGRSALPDTVLAPGARLLLWADGEPGEGPLHLAFRLASSAGAQVGLFRPDGPDWLPIDAVYLPALPTDVAYGRYPDDSEWWMQLAVPTPGAANSNSTSPVTGLKLNELMAINDTTLADNYGEFDDWVEILNHADWTVNLAGLFLTDDLAASQRWEFPAVSLSPHEYLLIWVDNDPTQGALHATFKLSGSGEQLGLFDRIANGHALIDSVTFGAQSTDVAYGRLPDGIGAWRFLLSPSPGATNQTGIGIPDGNPTTLHPPFIHHPRPNPFLGRSTASNGGAIELQLDLPAATPVHAAIYDVQGRRIRLLTDRTLPPGRHTLHWNGRNEQNRPVPAGVYLSRVQAGAVQATHRIVILK